ncbi:MAG: hypothetical protein ABI885_11875 [Gammaproteobacteria bacterium]
MTSLRPITVALLVALIVHPGTSLAADDVAKLRAELEALKSDYSTRVNALESRIMQLEGANPASAATPPAQAAGAATPASSAAADAAADAIAAGIAAPPAPETTSFPAPAPSAPGGGGAAAFNPAISMILAGNYASLSRDPGTYRIAGFIPNGGEGPGDRSFNLGESELTVAANVDPYFFANVTASVTSDNEIAIEEAYFKTLGLRDGLSLKGGRFFSGLGYLNEIHAHAWDFADQPLVYQAFFGGQLAQDGLQMKWLAPTDTFIEFGAEAGNGGAFPGTHRNRNGLNNTALFTHVGGDVGDSTSWRTGISWLNSKADDRVYEDVDDVGLPVENAFTGTSRTWIADAILKWSPHGDSTQRQLKLQGEYLHRTEDGQLAFDTSGAGLDGDFRSQQSGWYVQSVYLFRPRWRVGARYDSMDSGDPRIGLVDSGLLPRSAFPALLAGSPDRFTLMLDWSPSEFSRLRAQYAWDEARIDQRDRQFFLQYIYGIGAHGAHKF